MNGKKEAVEINIPPAEKKSALEGFSCNTWIWNVWHFCKEDSNRVTFSFKMGLSVLLVSLLSLLRAPYEVFGTNIIWSILTAVIMFEYTVGATFNRGFNRAIGTVLAGILAIAIGQLALRAGHVAEPIVIGISIFLIGVVTSLMKQWPSFLQYEYGFRVTLFTFALLIVSCYRMGNPIRIAMDRLYSIAIGGMVAVLVNALVFPIWAGEQMHKELVNNFNSVADSLEECVKKYLEDDGLNHPEFSKTVEDEFPDEPAYRKCRGTLNSAEKLENLANSAKWEPPHGRFRHFFYPWSECVEVGAVLRYCAYEVMALHGVVHSEIQAPHNLRITFQTEILDATSHAAELVRSLGKDISSMKRSLKTSLLKKVHSSTERLQRAIDMHSYLLTSYCDNPNPVTRSQTLSTSLNDRLADFDTNNLENTLTGNLPRAQGDSSHYYQDMMRKPSRRLHSWPPREVGAFEEEGGIGVNVLPRMRALESSAALSLATFTSLLIEFGARLHHLVEAVDKLSIMAKFKDEGL
ncbi:hypothetical protein SLEP1_g32964 [Rubroshorea leprosula]|uniref:Aluminum-activated malate transporter 9-like n=1 Tax=Rubroshorea leprosula TaxID=152421 RepID=A0AAV5KF33_9ROSI|nr:hypothetical protein SLEP1_g32964 [Rubroshorea leprosula]